MQINHSLGPAVPQWEISVQCPGNSPYHRNHCYSWSFQAASVETLWAEWPDTERWFSRAVREWPCRCLLWVPVSQSTGLLIWPISPALKSDTALPESKAGNACFQAGNCRAVPADIPIAWGFRGALAAMGPCLDSCSRCISSPHQHPLVPQVQAASSALAGWCPSGAAGWHG